MFVKKKKDPCQSNMYIKTIQFVLDLHSWKIFRINMALLLRQTACANLFQYKKEDANIWDYEAALLPPDVFIYQMNKKSKTTGEISFKKGEHDKLKSGVPLANYLELNERFKKVLAVCLMPEDFGVETFPDEFAEVYGLTIAGASTSVGLLYGRMLSGYKKWFDTKRTEHLSFEKKRNSLARQLMQCLYSNEAEKMDQFFIDMVAKKGADGFHKKGQYKLRIKLLLGKSNIFQGIGKKYIAKK